MKASTCKSKMSVRQWNTTNLFRRVNEGSILAIQIFDQRKFKKRDQGFLGVINVRIGSVIDMDIGGDGMGFLRFTEFSNKW